jgi:H+/Cl- antiporter ClcA
MAFDRTKLLISFAFLGFLLGSGGYYFFNWFLINSGIRLPPIADIVFSPLFVSGFTGSLLSILVITIFSHLARK